MTDTELYALEAAAKAATPGPWIVHEKYPQWVVEDSESPRRHILLPIKRKVTHHTLGTCDTEFGWGEATSNAAYIAAANPAVVLELIQELRQARDYIRAFVEFHQQEATCQK